MAITVDEIRNGLALERDLVFAERPEPPEMRESTSIWLFEENGAFAFPRIGIEAEAHAWDNRSYQVNINMGDGRILLERGQGAPPSPYGPDGRPTILGAGGLAFECIDPFRKWAVRYDSLANQGTFDEMVEGTLLSNPAVPISFEVELDMVTPAWRQETSDDELAGVSELERTNATSMGVGWRFEHHFRGRGKVTLGGETREFNCLGLRVKRQSVRPLDGFRGHCWQSCVFPDGRAFGFITYPPLPDGTETYNEGFVYQDGKMHPATVRGAPWLKRICESEDASFELVSELGVTKITGTTMLPTFSVMEMPSQGMAWAGEDAAEAAPGVIHFTLQQGGARYVWGEQSAMGMIERSTVGDRVARDHTTSQSR